MDKSTIMALEIICALLLTITAIIFYMRNDYVWMTISIVSCIHSYVMAFKHHKNIIDEINK